MFQGKTLPTQFSNWSHLYDYDLRFRNKINSFPPTFTFCGPCPDSLDSYGAKGQSACLGGQKLPDDLR